MYHSNKTSTLCWIAMLIFVTVACTTNYKKQSMKTIVTLQGLAYDFNLEDSIDVSNPIQHQAGARAWYIDAPQIKHVEVDGYVGKVALGGSTNFNNIHFNPHSHGTHTECVGHITKEFFSVNNALNKTFFKAYVISVQPEKVGDDLVITAGMFDDIPQGIEAILIRTLPNEEGKKQRNYSHTNPPYLEEAAATRFRESGIDHLLIDMPSVDKEKDDGALLAHKAFWDFNGVLRTTATITELIYVPDHVRDGLYMLDLQVAPIENDAAPSRPILYKMTPIH